MDLSRFEHPQVVESMLTKMKVLIIGLGGAGFRIAKAICMYVNLLFLIDPDLVEESDLRSSYYPRPGQPKVIVAGTLLSPNERRPEDSLRPVSCNQGQQRHTEKRCNEM